MTRTTDLTAPVHPPYPSTEPPPIWFLAPEGFFALPLAASPEERADRAQAFVRELYSRGDDTIWEPAAPYFAAMAELMGDTGLSYAAMGLFSTSEQEPTPEGSVVRQDASEGAAQCVFTLAAIPTDHAGDDTDVVAQGVFATLSNDPYNEVHWLDLPCGPAVACVTWRQFKINPNVTAKGEPTDLVTAQIQVHVPFPTGPFTAVFTLFTAYVDQWAEFTEMMGAIMQTVSFVDPAEALSMDSSREPHEES
ncbi:hypothetical protein [Streptomyces sp. S.PNR 29]|uniref:hypothetical protein n=1 Tax=Streptomyces sp. S.PNR 29 TaxID=2973805 RepID=UPI0025B0249E|nr:hypothetical protein [Streptomyces sp. S.PNR 29]MDN0193576.1 hypothetical protein [Streptomyces sp. S.PNR 29]